MTSKNYLPLEKLLMSVANKKDQFPDRVRDYWTIYVSFLDMLIADIYPKIDAGLASVPGESGLYTAHGAEHFDEVVIAAGYLLGIDKDLSNEAVFRLLEPYELYVLLMAIRIHDIGNIEGRVRHEKKCFIFLKNMGALAGNDDSEKKIIARIAEAHGGKTDSGEKDTIFKLETNYTIGTITIRPRLLAAIVRFADEVSENRKRAANYLLDFNNVPRDNEIYHEYAKAITSAKYNKDDKRFHIQFTLKVNSVSIPKGCEKRHEGVTEVYIIDEILHRLTKLDQERRYCNRFMRELCIVDGIRATISVVDDNFEKIDEFSIEIYESGYPNDMILDLHQKFSQYCGKEYGDKLIDTVK